MNHQIVRLPAGLYFVATPIGTARDITLRALDILASAEVLAAEDTRSLRKLMEIHGVSLGDRRVLSYHDHSGEKTRAQIVSAIASGQSVAYASEAGMPLIADPGYHLSRSVAEAGHLVTTAPGPSAILSALTLGGLPTDAFFFAGFLPNSSGARKRRLEELIAIPGTLAFYESPKRVAASLSDMAQVLGNREAAFCRELTKKFETVKRAPLADLAAELKGETVKGEVVILVDRARAPSVNESDLTSDLKDALQANSVRDAADIVAQMHGVPRKTVYKMALDLKKGGE